MTPTRRIAKLEEQLASLRARHAARTDQLLLVLLQIQDVKAKAEAWDALARACAASTDPAATD